ncbi:C4-dicarboxylate ABC transporter permease (plasmid) [Azospirillum brasilense]|uniref:C4-dicarboxylate ABC transporter permease n=1 Tax=Azospirillum brasilense TaxID=192 RepID=A0A4D8QZU2_AZOBR|nr:MULTISPECIES: tripartite tricarboxylate transporter permease [Azospirillum]MDW7554530.1 tripartite tricarboxylate transporter permease [Azospirillum brasilense]MDW7593951.1 tripartite tricarboxylate transporter permease [Azospirillum brasilense]MDW7632053.1 tripartite tricarboxylate transporter permease [Azospirillum brasilense]MDX5950079.1 tripartite tricarboxylate transporter permease [Azospirillum brasilense]OPH13271.1 C4-dicarboxylate ABC transporter permease [Azospirillum brasilense]
MLSDVLANILTTQTIVAIVGSAIFGLFMGAIPGLTATMATALLVPITFFLDPVPAVATMITAVAVAIFAGDIPGCLLRMPGTPASAAYTDESYLMALQGGAKKALGIGLLSSAFGGLFGTAVLVMVAPSLAEFAVRFSSAEYFWLVVLGLSCAAGIGANNPLKGLAMLMLGLAIATVGMNNNAGIPRFTFGEMGLLDGVALIPMMVGMFAISEILRYATNSRRDFSEPIKSTGSAIRASAAIIAKYPVQLLRGSAFGTVVGALPGAGADIAAWMSMGMSKARSKTPEKFGTGHPEGLVEAGAANNSSLASAWIPALVFGIPGDSITAIVIGVLYMKNLNPGMELFTTNAVQLYSLFAIFVIANLVMIPVGWAAIHGGSAITRLPRRVIMPCILIFCILGSFAINNSSFDIAIMLFFGVFAFFLEEAGFPIAPAILGVVLGPMLENYFVTTMTSSGGDLTAFLSRPIAGTIALLVVCVWAIPLLRLFRSRQSVPLVTS